MAPLSPKFLSYGKDFQFCDDLTVFETYDWVYKLTKMLPLCHLLREDFSDNNSDYGNIKGNISVSDDRRIWDLNALCESVR
jgi:hypothetical protein